MAAPGAYFSVPPGWSDATTSLNSLMPPVRVLACGGQHGFLSDRGTEVCVSKASVDRRCRDCLVHPAYGGRASHRKHQDAGGAHARLDVMGVPPQFSSARRLPLQVSRRALVAQSV